MKNKGSTLLLGMVIVSVVLASGIGVSTLLLRQMRESGEKEAAAVAFYVARTVADKVSRGILEEPAEEWKTVSWEGVEREIKYKKEDKGEGAYLVGVSVDGSYYFFTETSEGSGEGSSENIFNVYYNNPNNWSDVKMHYDAKKEATIEEPMTESSEYPGWWKNEIDVTDIEEIRTFFCDGSSGGGCVGIYPNLGDIQDGQKFWQMDEVASIFITGEGSSENIFNVYYNNPNNWSDVKMYYDAKKEDAIEEPMTESSEYPGWWKNEIDVTDIEEIRTYFCDGSSGGECVGIYPVLGGTQEFWYMDEIKTIYIW